MSTTRTRTISAAAATATATAQCVTRSMRITLMMLQVVLPLAVVILRKDKLPLVQSALLSSSPLPRKHSRPQLFGRTKCQRCPGNDIPSVAFLSSSSSSSSSTLFFYWLGRESSSSSSSERTRLYGRAIKRSSLGKEITSSALDNNKSNSSSSSSNKKKTKKKGAAAGGGGGGETTGISPALAEWMAKGGEAATEEEEEDTVVESSSERTISATEFVPFDDTTDNDDDTKDEQEQQQQEGTKMLVDDTSEKGKSKKKRNKKKDTDKSVRKAQDAIKRSIVQSTVLELKDLFSDEDNEKKKKKKKQQKMELSDILDKIRTLIHVDNPVSGLRVITASSSRERNYRMAWVGSDDAICHVGTGLHKVPLARLQEVFMTMGKNRVEILEVIRILGPFPNVKNTIRGDISIMKPSRGTSLSSPLSARTKLRIIYDSMIDGTGKEILAGTEENTRVVDLDVLFADESAIVCMVPPNDDEEKEENEEEKEKKVDDPLGDNRSKVILFLPEDDLDRKLEMLRVA